MKNGKTEEKIYIIPWDEDLATFIGNAIRPAEALEVRIVNKENKQAVIIVNDEFLSLAIGREGQNVRLASKLTGWNLDIQGKQMYADNGKLSRFELNAGMKPKVEKKSAEAEVSAEAPESDAVEATEEKSEASEAVVESTGAFAGLDIAPRTVAALEKAGVTDVETLKKMLTYGEKIKGVGEKSVEELKTLLSI